MSRSHAASTSCWAGRREIVSEYSSNVVSARAVTVDTARIAPRAASFMFVGQPPMGRVASTMGLVQAPPSRPRIGFVLSGGGSRGAYEAGIIHYLRTDLAKRLGHHVPIDIVTGTSVGAINAAFLAATMSDPATQAEQIVAGWRSLRIEELISLKAGDLMRGMRLLIG